MQTLTTQSTQVQHLHATVSLSGGTKNPTTYVAAQQIMRQTGMPADKALHVAMTRKLASNGHYLGLGASLPASQQAVVRLNSRDFELATMFGLPEWNANEYRWSL